MIETIRGRVGLTLEELIRAHPQKPPEEIFEGVAAARNIMQNCTPEGLGLDNNLDIVLFHTSLADRIIKIRIYDIDWIIHSPEFDLTSKDMAKYDTRKANLQASLDSLASSRQKVMEEGYRNSRISRHRTRSLELAANDLIARSSAYNEGNLVTDIKITAELNENWTLRWRNEFKIHGRSGHARQKLLYYSKTGESK